VVITLSVVGCLLLVAGGFYAANRFLSSSSSPELDRRAAQNAEVIFSGRASDLKASPGNTVQQDDSDASTVWVRSQVRSAKSSGSTDGVSLQVPAAVLQKIRGKRIRITVSAAGNAASPFAIAYSAGAANSGWVVFQPTGKFQDYSLNFAVPRNADSDNYVGIWSDIDGRGTPLAIRQVAITVLSGSAGS
jgi:hypothetical protein